MDNDTKFCTSCGEKILRTAAVCHKCGAAQKSINDSSVLNKNRVIAGVLAFFLGVFGVHWFYIGNKKNGLLMILLTVTTALAGISMFMYFHYYLYITDIDDLVNGKLIGIILLSCVLVSVSTIVAFIQGIRFLILTDEQFENKYILSNQAAKNNK